MNLNHLRIGNFARCSDACMEDYFRITAEQLLQWSKDEKSFKGWIEPVKLTDDLIPKMGLKFIGCIDYDIREFNYLFPNDEALHCGDLYLVKNTNNEYYELRIRSIDDGQYSFESLKHIKFVHELQNIIIDILDIELTIKS